MSCTVLRGAAIPIRYSRCTSSCSLGENKFPKEEEEEGGREVGGGETLPDIIKQTKREGGRVQSVTVINNL